MRLRSLLFVPGHRPDVIAKTPRSNPDAVVIDWEDAVPSAEKDAARDVAAEAVAGLPAELPVFVRVNPPTTAEHAQDVAALPTGLAGVVLPKVERRDDVTTLRAESGLEVIGGIETAKGAATVEELAEGMLAVYFGAEDFTADMGGSRTPDSLEVLYARSRVVLAARVAGAMSLDQIVPEFRDAEAFRRDARFARTLGYTGKMCIHPSQVAIAHEVFAPSADEIARAQRIKDAHEAAGGGVVAVDGQMIDEPLVRRAIAILESTA